MPPDKVCKTIHQYNREPVSQADMEKLQEIAEDYKNVKNYVYARYGGIGSLSKIYPGYTVQNEMTKSGLRGRMGMPSVYFYLAVFDALQDIRGQWSRTKSKVLEAVNRNDGFAPEEKHYLRFLIKAANAFDAVLNGRPVELPGAMQKTYEGLAGEVDGGKLDRFLCRQVRRKHVRQHTDRADGFSLSEKAYRYGDHGIYISIKEKRKRIFIPLTDNNQYRRQIYIKLLPEERGVEIKVPVDIGVRSYDDYTRQVGTALGIQVMLTTDGGHRYGEKLGEMQSRYNQWIRTQTGVYNRNRKNNPGRKKYHARKRRLREGLHSYINHELNRFLEEEKPGIIYMAKLPGPRRGGKNARINHEVSMWQRGYIRKRLEQKCRERSVEMAEVLGKNISRECSRCGGEGMKKAGRFICPACGLETDEKTNTAKNAKRRGQGDMAPH